MQEIDLVLISNAKDTAHYQLTADCIESINKSEDPAHFKFHIVVMESVPYVDYPYSNVRTVHPSTPFGYHKYLNIGRRMGTAPYVCLCNNDLLFEPGWASEMVKHMEAERLLSASPYDPYSHPQKGYVSHTGNHEGYAIAREMTGWCIFQQRKIYELIGDLDEAFVFWYADNDYAQVLKQHYVRHMLLTSSVVRHLGSQTLKQLDDWEFDELTTQQRVVFENKWKHHMTKLSILIATVPNRTTGYLSKLLAALEPQVADKPVEVLYLGDFCRMSIGQKRNELVRMASGDYTVFIDDDDRIAPDYVDSLLHAMHLDAADVLSFDAVITVNGADPKPVFYSKNVGEDSFDGNTYFRRPNHLMAIRSTLTKATPFPELNFGEDTSWADSIFAKLRSENRIDKTLYYYDFNSNESMSLKRKQQDEQRPAAPVGHVNAAPLTPAQPAAVNLAQLGAKTDGALVTFVVPTVGRLMLSAAVSSLLAQTNPNWKAIILFDGVKNSLSVQDPRLTVIELPVRVGKDNCAGLVRNIAFPYVETEWVAFLDDDDELAPQYVQYLAANPSQADVRLFGYETNDYMEHQNAVTPDAARISFCANMQAVNEYELRFVNASDEAYQFLSRAQNTGLSCQIDREIMYRIRPI